jgi:alpha-1,3-rhamnosyl/mannosyltransferase
VRREGAARTILYVGRFDPYKNLPGLIRAFARVREISRQPVRLRVVGSPDPRYPEAQAVAQELKLEHSIDWVGYAGGRSLVKEYQQADVFALLSKYEGFGLTVLEAMACGTPVVCSNRSSLPEVAGSAGVLVDPDDIEAAARAIARVLEDPRYAGELREQGLSQAARFRWTRTAVVTLDAYRKAAAASREETL